MATDTTVDWGRDFERIWGEGDNRYFRKFWRNVVRWLSENSDAGSRRLRVETDKVIYRPVQDIQVTVHAYDEKQGETDQYRLVARLHNSAPAGATPFEMAATNLVPQLGEPAYRGKLPAPSASATLANSGTTVHPFVLEVAALDGDREVGGESSSSRSSTILPNFATLVRTLRGSKGSPRPLPGRVIQTPAELATALGEHPQASVSERSSRGRRSGTRLSYGWSFWDCSRANGSSAGSKGWRDPAVIWPKDESTGLCDHLQSVEHHSPANRCTTEIAELSARR